MDKEMKLQIGIGIALALILAVFLAILFIPKEALGSVKMVELIAPPTMGLVGALWVYFDARKRYKSSWKPLLWAVGTFLNLITISILYFIFIVHAVRPERSSEKIEKL